MGRGRTCLVAKLVGSAGANLIDDRRALAYPAISCKANVHVDGIEPSRPRWQIRCFRHGQKRRESRTSNLAKRSTMLRRDSTRSRSSNWRSASTVDLQAGFYPSWVQHSPTPMAISNYVPGRPGDLNVDRQVTVVQFLVQLVRACQCSGYAPVRVYLDPPLLSFRFVNAYCMYLGLDNGPPRHKGLPQCSTRKYS